jgi:hypothetical protein
MPNLSVAKHRPNSLAGRERAEQLDTITQTSLQIQTEENGAKAGDSQALKGLLEASFSPKPGQYHHAQRRRCAQDQGNQYRGPG